MDHGTEFTSRALDEWAYRRGVLLDFIRPGTPVENGFIESFNGKLRDECLNANQFLSIEDARSKSGRGRTTTTIVGHTAGSEMLALLNLLSAHRLGDFQVISARLGGGYSGALSSMSRCV